MSAAKKDFGAFELHEKIGAGGMASVYMGVQKSLDRKVVLKVLHPHLAEDDKFVQRFEREARAAAMLRHPNIVQVIDCGRHDDVAYIAMEFVEGMDLQKWMKEHGAPPFEIALLMTHDLCSGLEHAHQNRIVHRDIKPANLMMTPDGFVKIMDFGLARRGEDATAVTVVGSVLGTPAYMSPEQASGETVDERSDIFSAGVVAFELLGGVRPFQGDSYSSVIRQILTVDPPSLGESNPLLPDEAVNVVHRMLQKDMSKRYPTIGQVARDLEIVMELVGVPRGRELLREYAADPAGVTGRLRKKRLARHLDQGLYYENLGLGKIDDALREFRRVLFVEPQNKTALEHAKKLEREREKLFAERGADATVAVSAGDPTPQPARAPARERTRPAATAPAAAPARKPAAMRRLALGGAGLALAVIAIVTVVALGKRGGGEESADRAQVQSVPSPMAPVVPEPSSPGGQASAAGGSGSGKGALRVITDPRDAQVFLNDGSDPSRSNVVVGDLSAGENIVRVERTGYMAAERRVTVAAGDTTVVRIALQPAHGVTGTLVVKVSPYASLFVDGKPVSRPDLVTHTVELEPGRHVVRAVHPKFAPKEWTVEIAAHGTKRLSYDFIQGSVGTLRVTSPGVWAYVWIDGVDTQKATPFEATDLKPGRYSVTLVREGFVVEGGPQAVTIREGQVTTAEFKLKPAGP